MEAKVQGQVKITFDGYKDYTFTLKEARQMRDALTVLLKEGDATVIKNDEEEEKSDAA